MASSDREQWASRLGLILAMAGNAIGLGNFLRFPRLAAQYGGGAFLLPYFVALLLLGIPLMWLEWSMGRYGGQYGHHTTPGMFGRMGRSRLARCVGSLGLSLPLLFAVFYTYIESWTLAYACFSATGAYFEAPDPGPGATADVMMTSLTPTATDMPPVVSVPTDSPAAVSGVSSLHTNQFLRDYQGVSPSAERRHFFSLWPAIGFWLTAVALNCWIISRGLSAGIERLAKIAMPMLFLFAFILAIRVLAYGTPDPTQPERSVWAGLNYVWQPDFRALADFHVWLMAAGQIFFTLSIGTGSIQCYASYLKRNDDIALTGLTTAATNEFAEVVLGGTIAIPIAVATFGLAMTQVIASQGSFDLGFVAMPVIFETLPFGRLFGTLWFSLLFFAGITSSVGLCQPLVAFLNDEFGISRRGAAAICGGLMLILGLPIVLYLGTGYMDQYDFWVGTFGLVVLALAEVIVFAWIFRGEREAATDTHGSAAAAAADTGAASDPMWRELTRGAEIRIPRFFRHIIRYVVPAYLLILLGGWVWQSFDDVILMKSVPPAHVAWQWMARGSLLLVILAAVVVVELGARRRERKLS